MSGKESIVNDESEFDEEFNKLAEGADDEIEEEITEEIQEDIESLDVDEPLKKDEEGMYFGLNDEAKEYWKKIEQENTRLNHNLSSNNGRVRAYQEKNDYLKGQIAELNDLEDKRKASISDNITKSVKGSSDEWNSFKEENEELADILDNRAVENGKAIQDAVNEAINPLKEQIKQISNKEIEMQDVKSLQTVSDVFPRWQEEINTEYYSDWINNQPPGIKSLAESDNPDDAIALMGLFDMNRVADGSQSMKKATPDDGVDQPVEKQEVEASKLKNKRKQQLSDGITVNSRSTKINPGDDDSSDFEKHFNALADKADRQKRKRY